VNPQLGGGRDPATLSQETPTLLVPLDGSRASLAALPVARTLARLRGATLRVVHAAQRLVPPRELAARLHVGEEARGAILDEIAGDPAAGILRLAAQAASPWLVVAARTGEPRRGHAIGSTAAHLLARATCPVVMVRPERGAAPWDPRTILMPHDGTPETAAALGRAIDLSRRAGSALLVLHVVSLAGGESESAALPEYLDQPQHEWPEWSRALLGRMAPPGGLPAPLRPRVFLARGDPGAAIVRFAEEHRADLVVVAWHGSFRGRHAAVVREVVLDAPCPVLFLQAEAGGRRAEAPAAPEGLPGRATGPPHQG